MCKKPRRAAHRRNHPRRNVNRSPIRPAAAHSSRCIKTMVCILGVGTAILALLYHPELWQKQGEPSVLERWEAPQHIKHYLPFIRTFNVMALRQTSCSAVAMNAETILSAAHCFKESYKIMIYFDVNDINDIKPGATPIYRVKELIKHPKYDLAIAKLDKQIKGYQFPSINFDVKAFSNETLEYCGWGELKENGEKSGRLSCGKTFVEDAAEIELHEFNETHIMITDYSCSSCVGDSGGPVFHHGQLVGIISGGSKETCQQGPMRCTFMRLAFFQEWLEQHLTGYLQ